jgi:hypothetical protein
MIRIDTKEFVNLLGDLIHTADHHSNDAAGVLLHTSRGYPDPAEPGESDLLVGTSTNGRAIGHTWCAAFGQLPPMLWRLGDVRAVITVFKVLAKGKKDHTVDIRRDGDEITVAEDPQLFGETSVTFAAGSLEKYPRQLWRVLDGTYVSTLDTDAMPRTDLDTASLAAFARVARRHGATIRTYRYHQRRPILVEIGNRYRGAIVPFRWDEQSTAEGHQPDGDLYAPVLPDPDEAVA